MSALLDAPAGRGDGVVQRRLRALLGELHGESPATDALAERLARRAREARRACGARPSGPPRPGARPMLLAYPEHVDAKGPAPLGALARFCAAQGGDAFAAVHVLPFFPADGDFGYAVTDHRRVAGRLGSIRDLQALGERFELCADLVLHHVSATHPWLRDFLDGRLPFAPFVTLTDAEAAATPFVRHDGSRVLLATRYGPGQVDLDFREPRVLEDVVESMLWLLAAGVRWIRLDAIAFTWPHGEAGDHGAPVRALVAVLALLGREAAPDVRFIAEADLATRASTYLEPARDLADAVYDLALPALLAEACIGGDGGALCEHLRRRPAIPDGATCLNPLTTHDGLFLRPYAPVLSPARLERLLRRTREREGRVGWRPVGGVAAPYECNIALATLLSEPDECPSALAHRLHGLVALTVALQGTPVLYLNALLAAPSDAELVRATGDPRAVNRRVFCADELQDALRADSPAAWSWPRALRTLAIARAQAALAPTAAQAVLDTGRAALVAIERDRGALLCVANVSGEDQAWTLPAGVFLDVLTGHVATGSVTLRPHDTWWLVPRPALRNTRAPAASTCFAEETRDFYRERSFDAAPPRRLVLDTSYRRNHLPLVAPRHPDVIARCAQTDYRRGRYLRRRVSLVAFFPDECFRGAAWEACWRDLRAAPFAGKIDWRTHEARRHRLHATICGNLQERHDDDAIERIADAVAGEPPFAVRALGPWIGSGRNNGRSYLPLLQQRAGAAAALPTHRLQALAGLEPTALLVLGLVQFTDHLDEAETRALVQVLAAHRDATMFECVVDEVSLIATHDDLILRSEVLRRIELQGDARG